MNLYANIDILDEFLGLSKEAAPMSRDKLKATQQKELELWHSWNTNGRKPDDLKPLLDSYRPLLELRAKSWKGNVEIPTSTINKEYQLHFVNAVKTFNPSRGVKLNTWVDHNLKKAGRYMRTYQNMGKIPEGQISKITEFKLAKEQLTDKLGYEPDTHSLADHLGWSPKKVERMGKELRKDLPASGFQHDPSDFLHPQELEAIKLLQYELSDEERTIYEYTFGLNGKPQMSPGQISKVTKINGPKVSRIRNKLRQKLEETMGLL